MFDLLSKDLLEYILSFLYTPRYKLFDWIDVTKLNKYILNQNPKAIDLLKLHPHLICQFSIGYNSNPQVMDILNKDLKLWDILPFNESNWACDLIKVHIDTLELKKRASAIYWLSRNTNFKSVKLLQHYGIKYIDFSGLSQNTSDVAMNILSQYPNKIEWNHLCRNTNPNAVIIMRQNIDKINWYSLCTNESSEALDLLAEYPDNMTNYLSYNTNPKAIELLKHYPQHIEWFALSSNSCPQAVELLESNMDKINWDRFSCNSCPRAITILILHPHKISWMQFSENFAIEAINYMAINIEKIHWFEASNNKNPAIVQLFKYCPTNDDNLGISRHENIFEVDVKHYEAVSSNTFCLSKRIHTPFIQHNN